jgi:energy-converting hydrogenase B subunit Q
MGGEITEAVKEIQEAGILVVALRMAGSVTGAADLVVSDPVQAGTMAVMLVASTAVLDIDRIRGKSF